MRAAIVVACVLCASTASAQGIGREWLEKMSGPEPVGIEVRFPIACVWEERTVGTPIKKQRTSVGYWQTGRTASLRRSTPEKTSKRKFCVDFGFASLNNRDRDEEGFHVSAQRLEGALTWRLERYHDWLRAVEPSIAVGAIGFLTDTQREWRMDVSGRISVRLLDLIPRVREKPWASVVRLTFRPEVIVGGITDEDLGADPAEPFDHRFRWGGSWRRAPWITLDFSELAGLR
jgi:hypothetical protein